MNIYRMQKTIKDIIDRNDQFIKDKISALDQETNPEIKAYILGSIEGIRYCKTELIGAGLTSQLLTPKCDKHKMEHEELWAHEVGCPECHYEEFHYANEGVN